MGIGLENVICYFRQDRSKISFVAILEYRQILHRRKILDNFSLSYIDSGYFKILRA